MIQTTCDIHGPYFSNSPVFCPYCQDEKNAKDAIKAAIAAIKAPREPEPTADEQIKAMADHIHGEMPGPLDFKYSLAAARALYAAGFGKRG